MGILKNPFLYVLIVGLVFLLLWILQIWGTFFLLFAFFLVPIAVFLLLMKADKGRTSKMAIIGFLLGSFMQIVLSDFLFYKGYAPCVSFFDYTNFTIVLVLFIAFGIVLSIYIGRKSKVTILKNIGWYMLGFLIAGVLFFNFFGPPGSFCPTNSIPAPGYYIQQSALHNGELTTIVGQYTGTKWISANVFFVTSSTITSASQLPKLTSCSYGIPNGLANATYANITLDSYYGVKSGNFTCMSFTKGLRTVYTGSLWVQYSVAGGVGFYYSYIGQITVVSTS